MLMETIQYQKTITKSGYIKILTEEGWINEHTYIIEKFIGRKLTSNEVVHHINSNKQDNRLSNLMIFPNQIEHLKFHNKYTRLGYYTNPMKKLIKERWIGYKNVRT